MRRDRRLLLAIALAALLTAAALLLFVAAASALVWSALPLPEQGEVARLLMPRLALALLSGLFVCALAAAIAPPVYRRWIAAPARLLEQALVLSTTDTQRDLSSPHGTPELRGLADAINQLARQRDQLRRDVALEVAQASRGIEQERNRLAALMSELTQSVVVCNLDGRILLYNNRARMQFRALSDSPALAGGAELIGLGRSIYSVFDRKLVAHALENVRQRLQRGAASPSTQFVTTTRSGQLLRAHMAPVRGVPTQDLADADNSAAITGFVLMLDNITREYEQESMRERVLHGLTEGSRGSLANLQAAIEMLDDDSLDETMRARFLAVAREESQAMSRRINDLGEHNVLGLSTRWPLEEMMGADLAQAAQSRIETLAGMSVEVGAFDASLWLKLDSFSLLQALAYLASRLRDEFAVDAVQLRLQAAPGRGAQLDLLWRGNTISTETVLNWELAPMSIGAEESALTVRDVVQRHGGEFWFERDRARQQMFFRFLLPLAPAAASQEQLDAGFVRSDSRPEYFDFDLFSDSESSREFDDRRLVDLAYTVFDTETTGLAPAGGDEIIQIGATRLVGGKLLRNECFEQLVDPQRSIPAATIPIHGISPQMVQGQPIIDKVLPAFHAYARDTVLVAHNAAFDMRFLQLKEERTGVRFEQPVLDTLLLSALVHPNQESHRLEAIAERFNITVIGRHTALGDAMVTAEVFLKLLPLLAGMGIHTLAQARAAAQKTYYARIRY